MAWLWQSHARLPGQHHNHEELRGEGGQLKLAMPMARLCMELFRKAFSFFGHANWRTLSTTYYVSKDQNTTTMVGRRLLFPFSLSFSSLSLFVSLSLSAFAPAPAPALALARFFLSFCLSLVLSLYLFLLLVSSSLFFFLFFFSLSLSSPVAHAEIHECFRAAGRAQRVDFFKTHNPASATISSSTLRLAELKFAAEREFLQSSTHTKYTTKFFPVLLPTPAPSAQTFAALCLHARRVHTTPTAESQLPCRNA